MPVRGGVLQDGGSGAVGAAATAAARQTQLENQMVLQIKSVALLSKKHSRKLRYDVSRAHGPRAVAVVAGAGHPLLQRHHVCGEFHYRADARVAASPGCVESALRPPFTACTKCSLRPPVLGHRHAEPQLWLV